MTVMAFFLRTLHSVFQRQARARKFRALTLNVFFLTEAFLRVAVAGSMASLDSVPEASFMTTNNSLLFNDNEQSRNEKMGCASIFPGALY